MIATSIGYIFCVFAIIMIVSAMISGAFAIFRLVLKAHLSNEREEKLEKIELSFYALFITMAAWSIITFLITTFMAMIGA